MQPAKTVFTRVSYWMSFRGPLEGSRSAHSISPMTRVSGNPRFLASARTRPRRTSVASGSKRPLRRYVSSQPRTSS